MWYRSTLSVFSVKSKNNFNLPVNCQFVPQINEKHLRSPTNVLSPFAIFVCRRIFTLNKYCRDVTIDLFLNRGRRFKTRCWRLSRKTIQNSLWKTLNMLIRKDILWKCFRLDKFGAQIGLKLVAVPNNNEYGIDWRTWEVMQLRFIFGPMTSVTTVHK